MVYYYDAIHIVYVIFNILQLFLYFDYHPFTTSFYILTCSDNDFVPSLNSQFGCDFALVSAFLNETGMSVGIEIDRSIHNNLPDKHGSCITGKSI